jgi:hypothetical protein
MPDKMECSTHGDCYQTFVCAHLLGESAGLGFNREDPTDDNPFPDAWCDNCQIIFEAHGEWTDAAQELVKISLLCSGCYEGARIRNSRPSITLDDLKDLRWKCGSCDEWHTGPCLDFGFDSPHYWSSEYDKEGCKPAGTFLGSDFCAIEDRDFFVRGLIHLPIIGTNETLRWGVWGSLSRQNFEKLGQVHDDPQRAEVPAMFSWLSNRIPEYPETLSLKMYAHIQEPNERPHFELQLTDHPLSQQYHHGITPERVKEIMMERLGKNK